MKRQRLLFAEVPAWCLLVLGVAGMLLLRHGVTSGWVAAMAGEDSWVVIPPESEPASVPGRPRLLLVTLAGRGEARELARHYWRWCGMENADILADGADVVPAPSNLYTSVRRRYTSLRRANQEILVVVWYEGANGRNARYPIPFLPAGAQSSVPPPQATH